MIVVAFRRDLPVRVPGDATLTVLLVLALACVGQKQRRSIGPALRGVQLKLNRLESQLLPRIDEILRVGKPGNLHRPDARGQEQRIGRDAQPRLDSEPLEPGPAAEVVELVGVPGLLPGRIIQDTVEAWRRLEPLRRDDAGSGRGRIGGRNLAVLRPVEQLQVVKQHIRPAEIEAQPIGPGEPLAVGKQHVGGLHAAVDQDLRAVRLQISNDLDA